MTPKDPMARDFRELCKDSTAERTNHASIEELALYLRGDLPPEEQDRLRDHLTVCRPCQKQLLDLHSFRDFVEESTECADQGTYPPGLPGESSACCKTEVDRVWDDLWQSLSEGAQPKGMVNVSMWPHWNVAFGWTRISIIFLLTASLTWTSLLLSSWDPRVSTAPEPLPRAATWIERCVLAAPRMEEASGCLWRPLMRILGVDRGVRSPSLERFRSHRPRSEGGDSGFHPDCPCQEGLRQEDMDPAKGVHNVSCLGREVGLILDRPRTTLPAELPRRRRGR